MKRKRTENKNKNEQGNPTTFREIPSERQLISTSLSKFFNTKRFKRNAPEHFHQTRTVQTYKVDRWKEQKSFDQRQTETVQDMWTTKQEQIEQKNSMLYFVSTSSVKENKTILPTTKLIFGSFRKPNVKKKSQHNSVD
jgi:hypothetical protein